MTDNNRGAKITLYWLEQSRSHRILWLLEELGLTYELKTFKRGADKLAPPELKKIHPLGKSPVITIEHPNYSQPKVVAESAFITEYLCDHFGGDKLVPQRYEDGKEGQIGGETEQWMRYRYFMHYTEGSIMPILVMKLVMESIREYPLPFFIKFIPGIVASKVEQMFLNRNITGHFNFLEDQLKTSSGKYLCGNQLTAADIMMSFPVIAAAIRLLDKKQYPKVAAYAELLEQTDGYKKAVTKIEEIDGKFSASM